MREFVEQNQALAPSNVKGMVLGSQAQIWMQTQMLRLLPHLPGTWRDAIVGRVAGAIHKAATAITLKHYAAPVEAEDRAGAAA
jgi:hypothetical protein